MVDLPAPSHAPRGATAGAAAAPLPRWRCHSFRRRARPCLCARGRPPLAPCLPCCAAAVRQP
eukprot:5729219-Lingulodinium_polyedra.AAC.1